MPLVIPGMQSSGGDDKTSKWMDQLMGKKLGDNSDNVTFAKKDLPQQHRVVKGDSMMTMDHNPDRGEENDVQGHKLMVEYSLNIHVGDDGTVRKVTHG
ncbi:hypothetical protein D6C95_06690 [Aureobasidium pullulans]|nr:hypothetical protein D6C95_06690 [Aureobasidium pullulans]